MKASDIPLNDSIIKMSGFQLLHNETGKIYTITFNFIPFIATSSLIGFTIAIFMEMFSKKKTHNYRRYFAQLSVLSIGMYYTIKLSDFKINSTN